MKSINMLRYTEFALAVIAKSENLQIDQLNEMVIKYRETKTACNGREDYRYKKATFALGKKLLWLNGYGKKLTGTENGFISWTVANNFEAMENLCEIFIATKDAA